MSANMAILFDPQHAKQVRRHHHTQSLIRHNHTHAKQVRQHPQHNNHTHHTKDAIPSIRGIEIQGPSTVRSQAAPSRLPPAVIAKTHVTFGLPSPAVSLA